MSGDTLIEKIQIKLGAAEPWPTDVKLFQPHDVEQILLPDNSCCLAVQAFLKMCNLEYQVEHRANAEYMSPSGRLPFIKHGAFIVAELEGIVQFLQNKGITLTSKLSNEEKADMRAYMSLVNNVMLNAELYICWCDKETYNEVTKPRFGSVYPWPLNWIQTNSKRNKELKRLKMVAWAHKTLEEVYKEVENCCQALADRLEDRPYFFVEGYTEFDAIIYAHLYCMLTTSLPAHLGRIVENYPTLVKYCSTIDQTIMGHTKPITVVNYKSAPQTNTSHTHTIYNTAKQTKQQPTQTTPSIHKDMFTVVSTVTTLPDIPETTSEIHINARLEETKELMEINEIINEIKDYNAKMSQSLDIVKDVVLPDINEDLEDTFVEEVDDEEKFEEAMPEISLLTESGTTNALLLADETQPDLVQSDVEEDNEALLRSTKSSVVMAN